MHSVLCTWAICSSNQQPKHRAGRLTDTTPIQDRQTTGPTVSINKRQSQRQTLSGCHSAPFNTSCTVPPIVCNAQCHQTTQRGSVLREGCAHVVLAVATCNLWRSQVNCNQHTITLGKQAQHHPTQGSKLRQHQPSSQSRSQSSKKFSK